MTELSEQLKKYLEQKGIPWETQYGGAMARLVNVSDEGFVEIVFKKQADNAYEIKNSVDVAVKSLYQQERNATDLVKKLSVLIDSAKTIAEGTITNPQDAKIFSLYKSLLVAGKDVFGEERMSDSAIESICSSASYIVWRSVMGPKFEDKEEPRFLNRR